MTRDDPARVVVIGPLAVHRDGFRGELARLGCPTRSAAEQLRLMAHLSRWLKARRLRTAELTDERIEAFLSARRAQGYHRYRSGRAVKPLLAYLRSVGAAPGAPDVPSTELEVLLADYHTYLLAERGLDPRTVRGYDDYAREFLSGLARENKLALAELGPAQVRAFILAHSEQWCPKTVQNLASALRALLRYLYLQGHTDKALAPAVPAVAAWRGVRLPRTLRPAQVRALLHACDRRTAVGRRDYAIFLLLCRLGLRAGEVSALELDDFDWRAGEVIVRGKGRRDERLPLPVDVGQALVAYLGRGRAASGSRRLFLPVRPPGPGMSSTAIRAVVRHLCARAGLVDVGTHRLRHTAATQMLAAGASLPEIGQLLRHRHLITTSIYAKVDRARLGALARPWPGGPA